MEQNEKLQKAISILYDMEINNYFINREIKCLTQKINSLAIGRKINKPVKNEKLEGDFFSTLFTVAIIFAIIGAVILAIIELIIKEGIFSKIFNALGGIIVGAFYGAIVGAIISIPIRLVENSNSRAQNEKNYENALQRHNNAIVAEKKRIDAETRQKDFLITQRNILLSRKIESEELLSNFYKRVGIDNQYRNIICMAYMDEFIKLRIANKLDGADGLYYLVRKELRYDQMQYTLDEISEKLDDIIDNQHMLYGELIKMNEKCNRMLNLTVENSKKLKTIENNTAISAYNSERIAAETSFQNFMLTYSILN